MFVALSGVTKSAEVVRAAAELAALGASQAAIARRLGVSRAAVRDWLKADLRALIAARELQGDGWCNGSCVPLRRVPPSPYTYLLGLYLGDGWIATHPRGVYRLRITCCDAYPRLMDECRTRATSSITRLTTSGCCSETHAIALVWSGATATSARFPLPAERRSPSSTSSLGRSRRPNWSAWQRLRR